jgi:hypothetical protein
VNVFGVCAPRMSSCSMLTYAGIASGGVFAPPILMTPRSSFQKLSAERVTALAPSITGSAPLPSGTPRTTIGATLVPARQITHLS